MKIDMHYVLSCDDFEKNVDWYNDVYAKHEISLNPEFDILEYYSLGIVTLFISIFSGLLLYTKFDLNFFILVSISFIFIYGLFMVYKKLVDNFNDLKIIEQTEEWIDKDDNGDRYIIFYSYDSDLDHTQLKLTDSEYNLLKKYKYEIEHNYSFPNYDEILEKLEKNAIPTLFIDLKLLNSIVI